MTPYPGLSTHTDSHPAAPASSYPRHPGLAVQGGHDSRGLYVTEVAAAYGGALHPAICHSKFRSPKVPAILSFKTQYL